MGATNPKSLAAFSFIICAAAVGFGFGFGFTGGDLVGWGDWMPFLGIVLGISLVVSLVVWGLATMIQKKSPK